MKRIEFKTLMMKVGEREIELDYKRNMMQLLLTPLAPKEGGNYEEMAIVVPIHMKFKGNALDHIFLEDAEHDELLKRMKKANFIENTPEIFDMIQSVIDAPDHLVEAQEA